MTDTEKRFAGYRVEDRAVAMTALPGWIWALMLVLFVVPLAVYILIHSPADGFDLSLWWVVWMLALMLLHEGTHAVAWKLASGLPWSVFTFGVQWKTATPYCHSREPMAVRAYRIGARMPLFVTGLLPWLVSLVMGYADLAFASAALISGAAGDLYVLRSIRDLPDGVLVQDHDTKAGCIVLWPEGPAAEGMTGAASAG